MADVITRFKVESTEYERKINSAKSSMKDFERNTNSLGKALGVNLGGLTKMATALGAASAACKVAKDAFLSTEKGVDEWGRTMKASESVYRSFVQSLNNASFGSFLSNIGNVINRAKEAYNALDKLNTNTGIISNAEAMYNAQRARYQKIIKDPNATASQKAEARAGLEGIQAQKAAGVKETQQLNNDYIKSALRDQASGLTDAEYNKYYSLIVKSLYDTAAKDILDKTTVSRTSRELTADKNGKMSYQNVTRNMNVGDLFTDEFRAGLAPYIRGYWGAEERMYQEERADNRIINSGSGKGSGGKAKAQVDMTFKIDKNSDFSESELEKIWQACDAPEGLALKLGLTADSENVSELKELISGQKTEKLEKPRQKPSGLEETDKVGEGRIANEVVGGVASIASNIESLGIEVPDGLKKTIAVMQVITTVMSTVASLTAIIAGASAAKAVPIIGTFLAGGGVVHAANGYVPGNYTSGDQVPAMLNSGELVLNKAQQGNLASQLGGGVMRNARLETYIDGKVLRLVLNNDGQYRGKGTLVTSKG